MADPIPAFPLAWPSGWKRLDGAYRTRAAFTKYKKQLTISQGLERVVDELGRMGVGRDDIVVSTNVRTRMDGFPRSVADNLAASAATLEAMRAIERHGGAAILERAFIGFVALPAPAASRHWSDVLGVGIRATDDEILAAYRALRSQTHPDKPSGDATRFDAVQKAYDQAVAEGRA